MTAKTYRMPTIKQRMLNLKFLLALRSSPASILLGPEVTKIHVSFNRDHIGLRRFWKRQLPSIKFRNPSIPMPVHRALPKTDTPTITIFLRDPATSSSSSTSTATSSAADSSPTTTHTIPCADKTDSEILAELVALTRATPVPLTPAERAELTEIEEQRERGRRDAELSKQVRARARREREMLEQARGQVLVEQNAEEKREKSMRRF